MTRFKIWCWGVGGLAVLAATYTAWSLYGLVPAADEPGPTARPAPVIPVPSPAEPGIKHPLPTLSSVLPSSAPLPGLAQSDAYVQAALVDLLGRVPVLTFLQTDAWVRRVVATVDNLAREHAPTTVWPVHPTPGRFSTRGQPGSETIHPDNGQRYTPWVLFVEAVDVAQAVKLYVHLYPLFQQAYEELGFPGKYFNDRLVQVIDLLLATPVQDRPLAVHLLEVKGPLPSERPWVRYEFAATRLEALSAGQKMLIRSGPVNHRRLRAKLMEARRLLAGVPVAADMAAAQATRP